MLYIVVITRRNSPLWGLASTYPSTRITASLSASPPGKLRGAPQIERRSIQEAPGQSIVQTISVELSAVRQRRCTLDYFACNPFRFVRRNLTANRRWTQSSGKHLCQCQGSTTDAVRPTKTAGLRNEKSGCARDGTGVLARKWTAWHRSDRWNERETCWNGKRKASGMQKLPQMSEIPRNWSVLIGLQLKDFAIPPSTYDISAETLSEFF